VKDSLVEQGSVSFQNVKIVPDEKRIRMFLMSQVRSIAGKT